jgi:lipopolysaccharide transport system permease protein
MFKIISLLNTLFRYRELFYQLVTRDIRLKYRRSVLGYIWSVLNPLLTMLVMYFVFSQMFRFNIPNFPVYLITGNLLFGFMQGATARAQGSVIFNAPLLKKVYVPKYIFTVSSVTSDFVIMLLSMIALFVVMLVTRTSFTWHVFFIVIPLLELYFFCLGLGFFLAAASVFFFDVQHLWDVFCTIWMYATPIFYPLSLVPLWLQKIIIHFNPLYLYITQFRDLIIGTPDAFLPLAVQGLFWAAGMLLFGLWFFSVTKRRFILHI